MKMFLVLAINYFLLFVSAGAQTNLDGKTDKERAGLVGSVKKVETYQVYSLVKGDASIERKRPWIFNSYDPEGKITEHTVFKEDGSKIGTDVYLYDAKGRNAECRTYSSHYDKNLTVFQKYVHKFDDNNNLIERAVYEPDGSLTARFSYKYNQKNNKVEEKNYYHTGALGGTRLYAYNTAGKLIAQEYYNAENLLTWKVLFALDENGKLLETNQYQGGVLRYKIQFKYDDRARLLKQTTFEFNRIPNMWTSHAPEPGVIIYVYNDAERSQEKIRFNEDGSPNDKTFSRFDERGDEVEAIWYESAGLSRKLEKESNDQSALIENKTRWRFKYKVIHQYQYDSHGNWTKKIRFTQQMENEKLSFNSAEHRVITYY